VLAYLFNSKSLSLKTKVIMARQHQVSITRRRFLIRSAMTGSGLIAADLFSKSGLAQVWALVIITSERMRPKIPYGLVSGDITGGSAIVWSRTDRPARMIVEYDTSESFRNPKRLT
jgi:alkaline phosphatase D